MKVVIWKSSLTDLCVNTGQTKPERSAWPMGKYITQTKRKVLGGIVAYCLVTLVHWRKLCQFPPEAEDLNSDEVMMVSMKDSSK